MIKFAQQKKRANKMQRKSSSCQNTCDTRVACRIIVAESKLFVAYFLGGVPHNLIMLMIMMRKFPICWAPLCNDKSFAGNFECQFTLFDSSSHGEGGEGGRIPQAVASNCCCPQSGPRAACLSYQLISMQRAAAIGHVD